MELNIKLKTALVTGGAVGIGGAVAAELAKEGARVFITSRSGGKLGAALDALNAISPGHCGAVCDFMEENAVGKLIPEIQAAFGGVDILVNNAGSAQGVTDPYCDIASWRKVFKLNVETAIELNNFFIPLMRQKAWGRIVNISSTASLENNGPVPYCASKAALSAYTRSMGRVLALEGGAVIMTAVLPGVIITEDGHWGGKYKEDSEHARKYLRERCPLGRFGKPEEISPLVAYLCSERATFNHGGLYLADAGQSRHFMFDSYLS
jgi:3-oxoacyl-[acyl-carrier protein] reductase